MSCAPKIWIAACGATLAFVTLLASPAHPQQAALLGSAKYLYLDAARPTGAEKQELELLLRALTERQLPAALLPGTFEIRQDGSRVDPDDIRISEYGETDLGIALVIAIDVSPTLEPQLEKMKAGALKVLDRVRDRDRVAILTFSTETRILSPFSSGMAMKRAAIEGLHTDSQSVHRRLFDGLHRAIELLRTQPDLPPRALVVVLSDGREGASTHDREQILSESRGGPGRPAIPIYGLGYSGLLGDQAYERLGALARDTTGGFLRVTSGFVLAAFVEDSWTQMLRSYLIRFPIHRDGEVHSIAFEMGGVRVTREAQYPEGSPIDWRWVLAAILVAIAVLVPILLLRSRSQGTLIPTDRAGGASAFKIHGRTIRIGFSPDNDLVLKSPSVSRRHAVIHIKGAQLEIEDAGSLNGTWINGEKIRRSSIKPGDKIKLADVEFVYRR